MIVVRRYLVCGQVQGVGFRFFTEEAAHREGLTGFVLNLADGSVEVVAEGDADSIARFERAIRFGPPLAQVEDLKIEELPPRRSSLEFEIRS